MQKLKWLFPLALILGIFFSSCEDNDPFQKGTSVEVTFAGQIIDENKEPVSGALVKAGDEVGLTDANGVFRLSATWLPNDHAVLTVEKAGYFAFSRAYQVRDKSIQSITIQLLSQTEVGTLNGGAGGSIQVPGGAKLTFPAGSIARSDGSPYAGSVRVFARFLDPTDRAALALSMPGNLSALNAAGELQQLSTFGMIAVELYSTVGQKLNVTEGSQVEVRIPIDPAIASSAPNEMPLWHYNEADGYWIEEGLAQKVGNEYVGAVGHFSWWNYDAPYPSVNVKGKVFFNNLQTPAVGVEVWIGPADQGIGLGCGHGQTDLTGFYSGAIPKDIPLKIWIYKWNSGCPGGAELYTANIGPFSADVTLPDIIVNDPSIQTLELNGRLVDCNNVPVANGYAKVNISGIQSNILITDVNGEFSFTMPYCSVVPVTGSIIGYDLDKNNESVLQNFTFNNNVANLGDITVCISLTEFVEYSLDGGSTVILPDPSGSIYQDSFPSADFNTWIEASIINSKSCTIGFKSNIISAGTFPLRILYVDNLEVNMSQSNLNTTVTSAALNPGDLIIGTFGGNFVDFNGGSHVITGTYRVKRDW
ncbi:MAG TPA: hypothetical protein DCF33_14550 [Saprospirales bacterium]|nr:hypothetical protein [Saprospirales bacterium]